MNLIKQILFSGFALGLFGCALDNTAPMEVAVSFAPDVQGTSGIALTDFDCAFVNILGPGLEPTIPQTAFGANPPQCIKTGIVSAVLPLDSNGAVFDKLAILAGDKRIIQVLAFKSNLNFSADSDRCPSQYLPDYFKSTTSGSGNTANWTLPKIYEVGRAEGISLFADTKLEIYKIPYIGVDLVQSCPSGT